MALQLIKKNDNSQIDFNQANNESQILNGLNTEQLQAVTTINGPLLIVAGAGSGKTRVITNRIAYLIEKGIAPYSILALTFTNKAAEEMKERIGRIVNPSAAEKIWAGTFHSVFAKILRIEAQKIGYTNSFSIYDADDQLSAVKNIMNKLGIPAQDCNPNAVKSRISWAKNLMISWKDYLNERKLPFDNHVSKIYQEYENRLIQSNSMDFDDLLLNMITLFNKSKETLEKYQNRFKYILVDEYQDTNRAQYIIINRLAEVFKNICVVGDDAQSIYHWRGADIRNILDFQKDYPNAKIIRLEQNYRSTKNILGAAASVIKHNPNQIPKDLWTANPEGDKIDIIPCDNEYKEADAIANRVKKKLLSGNYSAKDIAILYRTNAQSLSLENAFRLKAIPYMIIGGLSFYKRKEIKDVLAYLRLVLNPNDDEALLRIVNEPPRGLGATSISHIKQYATKYSIPLLEAMNQAEKIEQLQDRAVKISKQFVELINKYAVAKDNLHPSELVFSYIDETGLPKMFQEIDTEESLDRWNNIQQLLSDLDAYFIKFPEGSLVEYISQMSLAADIDNADTNKNQVKIMTLHSAKGLEFPIVFISGLEQGLFPFARYGQENDETEEERRLFYVGITRAKEKLYLLWARERAKFGSINRCIPSDFLSEIDKSFINIPNNSTINNKVGSSVPKRIVFDDMNNSNDNYSQIPAETNIPVSTFHIGDRVKHSHFGPGKIVALAGEGDKTQALVNFESIGRKQLMLKYAKLQKIG